VDKSLGCLPTILSILDFSTIKNELFPVVASVFSKTGSLGIKIRGLEAFVILCGGPATNKADTGDGLDGADSSPKPAKSKNAAVLDKYTVQEKVVPLLKAIKTKEPAVIMAALAVFKQIGKMVDAEFLALDVLPMLWSFSLGPLLNLQQFQDYMTLIKALSSRIEQEQSRKLSELSSNQNNAPRLGATDLMGSSHTNGASGLNGDDVGLNDFERLVLGKSNPKGNDMLGASSRSEPQRAQSTRSETPVFAWSTLAPNPSPTLTSRAITPGQTFNAFAALNPIPSGQLTGSSSTLHSFSTLTPLQPTLTPSPPWSLGSPASHTMAPVTQSQSPAAFSIPPPQPATRSVSAFSIAPPPRHPVQATGQTIYGQGLGAPGKGGSATQSPPTANRVKQKTGLDAFESLL
jgi:SCY1-like protein 2